MSSRSMFGGSKSVELKLDEFLDKVSEAALVFVAALTHSLEREGGALDDTERRRVEQLLELKRTCSGMRRELEAELYTQRLIPDLLGDVASLIESLHHLVEDMHHAMRFGRHAELYSPVEVRREGIPLVQAVGHAVEHLVLASRAFFRDFTHVRDHVHKVGFYESEADVVRDKMLDAVYHSDLGLAEKDHIARAVREVDGVADVAERIADMLTIYAIKRAE